MNNKEYLDLIEKLNRDYIELLNSREYILGRRLIEIKKLLKTFKIGTIFRKKKINKKIRQYNCKNPLTLKNYIDNSFRTNKKIAIYTCIIGNYDCFYEPLYYDKDVDYFLITDNKNIQSNKVKIITLLEEEMKRFGHNGVLINRYYKLNPIALFKDYDYTIYVDGSVEIISSLKSMIGNINPKIGLAVHKHRDRKCIYDEVKACQILKKGNIDKLENQVEKYCKEGFPKNYGMAECGIIVTDLKNKRAIDLEKFWWDEFLSSDSQRDQVSFAYALWKHNYKIDEVATLGENCYMNPKFRIHNMHKKI